MTVLTIATYRPTEATELIPRTEVETVVLNIKPTGLEDTDDSVERKTNSRS
jgi:hypothetical protein